MDSTPLTVAAKHAIDSYLSNRVVKAFAFLGIVNVSALIGLYFTVVDKVAETAAKKAITATEQKIAGATKQLDVLSSKTIDGLAVALQSVGEAKSKAKEINRDILDLQDLDLEKVGKVVDLLNKSADEIKALVNAADAFEEADKKLSDALPQVADNKERLHRLESKLNDLDQGLAGYATAKDLDKSINGAVAFVEKGDVSTLRLSEVFIEFGQAVTPMEKSGVDEAIMYFKNTFDSVPNVVATTYGNDKSKNGYPVIYDITKKSFKVLVKDQTGANTTRYKFNTRFNYIAIGKAK